ncbi:MAG: ketoacyl-ACP synthase III [Alistipes sp.]|jgi:3-oxoacyl-[acyl-carrier-protein] synthase-3|nr:ketoacyl-ACP synthase III [Alistipes sp.]
MIKTPLYINATGYYIPSQRIPNSYFAELYGKPEDWFVQRSGIRTRARATDKETIDYMSSKAVENALRTVPFPITEVDLIVFASYSPDDTVGTTAHRIQREYSIEGAKALYVSAACSSAINAVEIIRSFFASGIASKALLIAGDRNSTYSDDNDPAHGHLWGDAVVAYFMSKERFGAGDIEVVDIETRGLGHVGAGPDGVYLRPRTDGIGIGMPNGRDVFNQACTYIEKYSREILERNALPIDSLNWFVSHQANMRIVAHVCKEMGLPLERTLNNIEELGNTGCGSSLLALAQHRNRLSPGDNIVVSTFGGGYSVGAMLLKAL